MAAAAHGSKRKVVDEDALLRRALCERLEEMDARAVSDRERVAAERARVVAERDALRAKLARLATEREALLASSPHQILARAKTNGSLVDVVVAAKDALGDAFGAGVVDGWDALDRRGRIRALRHLMKAIHPDKCSHARAADAQHLVKTLCDSQ